MTGGVYSEISIIHLKAVTTSNLWNSQFNLLVGNLTTAYPSLELVKSRSTMQIQTKKTIFIELYSCKHRTTYGASSVGEIVGDLTNNSEYLVACDRKRGWVVEGLASGPGDTVIFKSID